MRHFNRYDHLAREGDRREKVLRLEEGWAARYRLVAGGARQITSLFLPGDLCEPQWMLTGASQLPVIALTPIRAVEIPLKTIHVPPGDGVRRLLVDMVEMLDRQIELIVSLGRKSAKDRIRDFLFELYFRLSRAGYASDSLCPIPITQQDIGDLLGLSAVHVNRVLGQLRQDGAIYSNRPIGTACRMAR
ncbi:Crp/Fnr family transcriptional regulator [Novosphingobium barchaimii]|uniref:Crp/Fnr family transcriptional regulator n=1 Tax=Novosphingobium barchaimii TaxID=1420591 RepID=UPI001F25DAE7|nr:Crp/Fnr family transcriptional regulator [Novosphingobium barchaimii]